MRILTIALLALASTATAEQAKAPLTPAEIVAAAPVTAWKDIPADDLLVMTLEGGKRIVIQLISHFSRKHVANIRALAMAHWWDGTSVYRVQDNYVAQWGDRSETKPLPAGVPAALPEDYEINRATVATAITAILSRDSYAAATGFLDGWPVAMDNAHVWPTHCYAMVGVARNLAPDAGNGAELYTVIGHAPRPLDRNIALAGRVIAGIENLSSLPRGTEALGMYGENQTPTQILSIRLGSDLPQAERPHFQVMDTGSTTFAAYADARANRNDAFFHVSAHGVDICNAPVPVRKAP